MWKIIRRGVLALIGGAIIIIAGWVFLNAGRTHEGLIRRAQSPDEARVPLRVEIADSHKEKTKGLSLRKSLCENCAMLFKYNKPQRLSFWMKDTYIPLDIAFLDHDNVIREIVRNLEPLSLEVVSSSLPAQYALEVNSGFFDRNKVKVGDRVFIDCKCGS